MESKNFSPSKIRVRFAPSPTGFLHIGGARTALFNWLFARHLGGIFQLRIEDTDRTRSESRFRDEILESLQWLGLNWDEGPIYQSDRFLLYRDYAAQLVKKGAAHVFEGATVFKMPPKKVQVKDLVYGNLEFDNSLLSELVILKSDGTPTYHFACVIDDALLKITHVIRGDDHLSNTPKQLALYEALEFAPPQFAHVPMILGRDGERLSKRHGATSVLQYKEAGFLPQTLINFLALLGWSPGHDLELMERDELVKLFSLERINRKSSIFNLEKLEWMNSQYLRKLGPQAFQDYLLFCICQKWGKEPSQEILKGVARLFQERVKTFSDFYTESSYFFEDSVSLNSEAFQKYLSDSSAKERLKTFKEKLQGVTEFTSAQLEIVTRDLAKSLGVKAGDLIHPTRVALTGRSVSPGIFEVMSLLGKETVLKRLEEAIKTV
ncbi:MAG: glutamate--tRNA ligase [Chlamydiae bacterium]|nr:glutamate--tRNA ligase [Chlamydiota bacterium]MBI3277432.1 glutamate--tRNA ligase [Chlamydiota bacterium]